MIALFGFDWLRPNEAAWLIVLPLVLAFVWTIAARRRRCRARLGDPSLVEQVAAERSATLGRVRLAAELLGLSLVGGFSLFKLFSARWTRFLVRSIMGSKFLESSRQALNSL